MRETTSQAALILLAVALLPSVASAKPVKPAHARPLAAAASHSAGHPATRASAHLSQSALRSSATPRGKASTKTEAGTAHSTSSRAVRLPQHPLRVAHWVTGSHSIDRHSAERAEAKPHREDLKPGSKSRSVAIPPARPAAVSSGRSLTAAPVRPAPAVDPPASLAETAPLPPIEVHHNRKIHFSGSTAGPAAPADAAPHPAPPAGTPPVLAPATPADTSQMQSGTSTPAASTLKHPAHLASFSPITPAPVPAAARVPDPVIEPVLYTARGRLIVPPAMKGSHEILLHQNEMADRDGLERVQDDNDLERLRAGKKLVEIPSGATLEVDERLPVNRRFCRPWTAEFLAALARAHYARFHTPLQVNSAVRTVEFQERLRYTNGNAAPADGETASPHLTGQAVDLAKHGLSMTEIAWLRGYLMPLVQQGKVDVEEEFQQSCFHISVYKKYMPEAVPKREIPVRRSAASALAAAIH